MPLAVGQAFLGVDRGVRMAGARPHLAAGVQRGAEVVGRARDFAVEQSGRLPPLGNIRAVAAPGAVPELQAEVVCDQPGQEHVLVEAVQAGGGCCWLSSGSPGSSELGVTDVAAVVGAEDV